MKEIMRKVAQLKGVIFTTQDVHNYLEEVECYMEKGMYIITDSHVMTIKVKGKVVDNKDVLISFEDKDND